MSKGMRSLMDRSVINTIIRHNNVYREYLAIIARNREVMGAYATEVRKCKIYEEVGDKVGMSWSTVGRIIREFLKKNESELQQSSN